MLFMKMQSDVNELICILFVHLSSIILENFNDLAIKIPEILEFIELHSYKFCLVCKVWEERASLSAIVYL